MTHSNTPADSDHRHLSLEYPILEMPLRPCSPDSCLLFGDEHSTERSILCIPPSMLACYEGYARYGCIPVQMIPQGATTPDVIADLSRDTDTSLTAHFSAIWNRVQRNNQPWRWERVSFSNLANAKQYSQTLPKIKGYLSVCPSCLLVHPPYPCCPLTEPMGLDEALSITGLALRAYKGVVYLASWNPNVPLLDDLWPGRIVLYTISRIGGLQDGSYRPYRFIELAEGKHFLDKREVPLDGGWIVQHERPSSIF